ncbi:MAG: hypothetical protein LC657_10095 [Desulfobacteraceae bacterium]|nr:hypothetical protein [Desulfobacteraceae bacterium]
MARPHGRKTRQKVGKILQIQDRNGALDQLTRIPDKQLVGHLIFHFYAGDELLKFRSVTAMGCLESRIASGRMENARNVMRRLMWNLNDESGGIGWGSAEAMGEILGQSPDLAAEFDSILFSFLDPQANFIDNPMLQQGILWGIGTYAKTAPDQMNEYRTGLIFPFLDASDPVTRGYAIRALTHAGRLNSGNLPGHIQADVNTILLYTGWHFAPVRICDIARTCFPPTGPGLENR